MSEFKQLIESSKFKDSVQSLLLSYWEQWMESKDAEERERLHAKAMVVEETIDELRNAIYQETEK